MGHNPLSRIAAFLAGTLLAALICPSAFADDWQASIYENGAPPALVGVDKKRGIFNFFEKNSPLNLRYSYPCVTGQLRGDKQQINDLRTPEGVYFVEYKIAGGLDFKEYGGVAYTLNYPNPVDRLRGKTGHGIWIHSKGFELVPTRGCVAIDLKNINEVGPRLVPGTAVVVAEELKGIEGFDNGVPAQLASLMSGWSNAWAAKSPEMFNYYDPEAYSIATENFALFKQNKEKLFKMLSFIKIYNREIHALEGPGYWVTWAEQLYTASNLSTEGVRRLYWQKDDNGRFRIVGMEWIPKDLGMRAEVQKGKLVAQATPAVVSDAASEAPQPPKVDMPEEAPQKIAPPPVPEKGTGEKITRTIAAIAEKLVAVSEPLIPKRQPRIDPPDEISWGIGKRITEPVPEKPAVQPEKDTSKAPAAKEAPQLPVEKGTTQAPAAKEASPVPAEKDTPKVPAAKADSILPPAISPVEIAEQVANWTQLLQKRDSKVSELYDPKNFNRLPASSGVPRGQSLATHLAGLKREAGQPWLEVIARKPDVEIDGPLARSEQEIFVLGPQAERQGVQTLWWRKDDAGKFRIVGARFQPQPLGLEANYLEQVSADITAMIEDWRTAWENGRMDDYISHYAPNAWQQGRLGAKVIRQQKEGLWSRIRPALVQLSGIRLAVEPRGIRADMTQAYADSAGRSDKGVKTLVLRYDGKKWLIHREDWAAANTASK